MTVIEAVRDAIATEMARDEDVVVFGEDAGELGGVFRATEGLQEEFGDDRVMDTPLSESAIVGAAVGMAAGRLRARTNGYYDCPIVLRAPSGTGPSTPSTHAESLEATFAHHPGLKVVAPSTAADTKGLLASSIRDEDPVVFVEPHQLYRRVRGEVPEGEHATPLGEAAVRREGEDVSVFTWGGDDSAGDAGRPRSRRQDRRRNRGPADALAAGHHRR